MRKKRTIRDIVINYVKANGPQSYSQLLDVVLIVAGQPLTNRHYGSSYIDHVSYGVTALLPTKTNPQHLVKSPADGLYHYVSK